MVDSYQETFGLIAKFTVESLQVKMLYQMYIIEIVKFYIVLFIFNP